MKKVFKIVALSALILSGFVSCKKAENRVIFQGGTHPVLTSSVSGNIPLNYADSNQEAVKLSWTNPNYQFNTGISSLDVSYTLEIDTTGSNFTNPKRAIISTGTNLAQTFLESDLNTYLFSQLKLQTGVSHNIETRITASLVGGQEPIISNVLKFTATPYAIPPKVTPPASGNLFIVGSAVSYGWSNPLTDAPAQQFTQVSPTDYQLTIPIISDGEYKFISVNGLWDSDKQWSIATEQASGDPSTLSYNLKLNGGNCRAPLASGTYKIEVDFQSGKVTLTKQ